jgi:hypothetical protein
MDPSDKKWLLTLNKNIQKHLPKIHSSIYSEFTRHDSIEHFIHFYLHSSGILYGYATKQMLCEFHNTQTWTYSDLYKISLTEGFYLIFFYLNQEKISSKENLSLLLEEANNKLYEFYILYSITDSFFVKHKDILRSANKNYTTVESIIDYRVNNPGMLKKGFWKGSQFNVFSYLDLLFFSHWLQNDYLYDKRNSIKKHILQIMIAASHCEGSIISTERLLVSYFLASGNFDEKTELELQQQLKQGLYLNQIIIDTNLPYDIRLLLFENAVISVLSDGSINNFEELFLGRLAEKLNISDNDVHYSIVMIQNFMLQNNKKLLYLHHKEGFEVITKSFAQRFQVFFNKNSSKIITEISESRELVELLWKAKNEKLTDEEREKVKEQIIDLLRTIPSLTIFMIPGGSILLPILLKILPEEILVPSSFRNK